MAEYKFVDHWMIRAPIDQVYRTIADPRTYPQWWPDYDRITILKDVPFPYVGGRAELLVKSPFGYRLRLEVETAAAEPPTFLATRSYGQLEGTGDWAFREEDGETHVTWTWIVRSNHPVLNRLEFVLKPLFGLSHVLVSGRGHRGLKRLLEPTAEGGRQTTDHKARQEGARG